MAEIAIRGKGDYAALRQALLSRGHRVMDVPDARGHSFTTIHSGRWQLATIHFFEGEPRRVELNTQVSGAGAHAHLDEVERLAGLVLEHYPRSVRR